MTATIIKNGTIVTADLTYKADVKIEGGRITEIGPDLTGGTVLDATGCYVMPGGIDPHVHLEMPFMGTYSADDFESGTRAALAGGTTMVVDFCLPEPGQSLLEALARWDNKATRANCDYSFHMAVTWWGEQVFDEMKTVVQDKGINSFKHFMAYKGALMVNDDEMFASFSRCAELGAIPFVHAENGDIVAQMQERLMAQGNVGPEAHAYSRPPAVEGEATNRAIQLALVAGAPVYFVHLSASEALERVAEARDQGHNVFAETCPQYLYLNLEDHLGAPGFAGAGYVCSPPLRTKHEHHHSDLWQGLRTNDLAIVSTDHCPFCMKEQKELGLDDFRAIPNGIGSVEHRMDLIYQGVVMGELTLERWVETCSTTPARMFGLYPQKGVIAPGADADIVLYDPNGTTEISVDTHHMSMDYSAYEGIRIDGKVDTVLSKGKVLIEDDAYHGTKGDGAYLRRGLSSYLN